MQKARSEPAAPKRSRKTTSKDGGIRKVRYFRVSDAEWQFIKDLAEEHGQTVSAMIRGCVLCDMPNTAGGDDE